MIGIYKNSDPTRFVSIVESVKGHSLRGCGTIELTDAQAELARGGHVLIIADGKVQQDPIPLMNDARGERNQLLAESDWTQAADLPEEFRNAWASYRQALRDLPDTITDPAKVDWPEPPAKGAK